MAVRPNDPGPPAERSAAAPTAILADGHVHLYPGVTLAALFAALSSAFARHAAAGARGDAGPPRGIAVLADPTGVDGFGRLANAAGEDTVPENWWIAERGDRYVQFEHSTGAGMLFVRGRQLVTEEGLEVLAAGVDGNVPNGATLASTINAVRARGGWSTIAWGVGKWLGRRGRLVSEAVRSEAGAGDVVLGDNGGRPWFWTSVPQFDLAAELGMRVLPGSDPLPVPGDEARIGSYAFEIELPAASGEALAGAFNAAIANRSAPVSVRGGRVGTARFAWNQVRLRVPAR